MLTLLSVDYLSMIAPSFCSRSTKTLSRRTMMGLLFLDSRTSSCIFNIHKLGRRLQPIRKVLAHALLG